MKLTTILATLLLPDGHHTHVETRKHAGWERSILSRHPGARIVDWREVRR